MRMDSHVHPLVVQGEKVSKLFSDNHYKEEWNEDKAYFYYPYHISPGYEQAKLNQKVNFDKIYKDKIKPDSKFFYTETDMFKTGKVIENILNKEKYSAKAKDDMVKVKPLPTNPEMEMAASLKDFVSGNLYKRS